MGNSTLHAIAIDELRYSNPNFYNEYELLIEGISAQIRELAMSRYCKWSLESKRQSCIFISISTKTITLLLDNLAVEKLPEMRKKR